MTSSMNPKQRYLATIMGQKPDKPPTFVGSYDAFLRHYYGMTARQFTDDPEANAEYTVRFLEEFNISSTIPAVTYIMFGCGPEMGVKWEFAGDNAPAAVEGPIKTKEDLEHWQIPTEPSGYFKLHLETIKLINDKIGDRVFLMGLSAAPHTNAGFLRGVEQTLMDAMLEPDFYAMLMNKCVEHSIYIREQVAKLGLPTGSFFDIFVTPTMMSPDFYHTYVAPYNRKVIDYFAPKGDAIIDTMAPFMGQKGDLASQKQGRYFFDYLFGTKENLDIIKAIAPNIPMPSVYVTLSGRMMNTWSVEQTLDFVKKGLDYVLGLGKYPMIQLVSVDTMDKEAAKLVAEKLKGINKLIEAYQG